LPLSLVVAALLAWPVDMVHDVENGREKFVKLAAVEWVEVEDPSIATAEIMESGELLLSGVKPGRTLVLLYAEGRFAVWRVRVGGKPELVAPDAAKKACPDLKLTPNEDTKLTVTVQDDKCWKALFELFKSDAFVARELDVTFDQKVLQTQLKSVQDGLKKGLSSRYLGAGLVLEGEVTPSEHRKVLWELFRRSVGRVALDDKLEDKPEPPDAGPPPKRR
jgi:hypothetical protein